MYKILADKVVVGESLVLTEDNVEQLSEEKRVKLLYILGMSLIDRDTKDKLETLLKFSNNDYKAVTKALFRELMK